MKKIFFIILFIGIALRLIQYFINRSLWLDEAKLALNILDRDWLSLLKPLDYNQVAPVLFLLLEKLMVTLSGGSEFTLRLIPLLSGIASIPLMYRFTKQISGSEPAALTAMFIFSVSEVIIRYSSELKQYETDIFSALLMLAVTFDSGFAKKEKVRILLMGICGTILIFLSNITILVLFIIALFYLLKYNWRILKQTSLLIVFATWAVSFLFYYSSFIYHHPHQSVMVEYWKADFMPLNFFSSAFWNWFYEKLISLFIKIYAPPFIFIYLISIVIFIIKENHKFLFFMLMPLLVHFLLSGFRMYPFETRLVLYLSAFITPFMSVGLIEIVMWLNSKFHKYSGLMIFTGVLVFMIVIVCKKFPYHKEEIKESFAFIEHNITAQQKIYLYYGAAMATEYYRRINNFPARHEMISGHGHRNNPADYITEILKLDSEVWLLFSHVYPDNKGEEEFILNKLTGTKGATILKSFKTTGSSAYLVKLDKASAQPNIHIK